MRRSGWIRARVVLDAHDKTGKLLRAYKMSGELRRQAEADGRLREVRENYPAAHLKYA
jgi:hypothetical protein